MNTIAPFEPHFPSRAVTTAATASKPPESPLPSPGEMNISAEGRALLELFATAGANLKQEALAPFTGMTRNVNVSYYVDTARYNRYLATNAATALVEKASEIGVTLDAKEVERRLIEESGVSLDNPLAGRRRELLPSNVYGHLTESDVEALTDIYIAAKERGLPAEQVSLLGFHLGSYRLGGHAVGEGNIYPASHDIGGKRTRGVLKRINQPSEETLRLAKELRTGGRPLGGLDAGYVDFALNPKKGLVVGQKLLGLFAALMQPQAPMGSTPDQAVRSDLASPTPGNIDVRV